MDCPDPDEEFELMYEDELEYMKDMEDEAMMKAAEPIIKSKRSLDFSSQPLKDPSTLSPEDIIMTAPVNQNTYSPDGQPLLERGNIENPSQSSIQFDSLKRKVDELFGDITDLNVDDNDLDDLISSPKRNKTGSDEELIKRILSSRRQNEVQKKASNMLSMKQMPHSSHEVNKSYVSAHVPKWPFLPVTNGEGERVYVRIRSEQYMVNEYMNIAAKGKTVDLLTVPYKMIMQEAESLIQKKLEREDREVVQETTVEVQEAVPKEKDDADLWVERYKPRSYIELLSDEATNRTLLHWLKLWDKVVFNREKKVKHKQKHAETEDKRFKKKKGGQELTDDLDEHGCPKFKMALLCGPPGLGKTTLAHMIGQLAGYNIVEVNASDERSPDAFRTALQAATQMKAVIGEKRPNCLVLDEIDGAPPASIEVLVKFATGKDVGKGRGKKMGTAGILKRPIICICNDVYVPALRPLRPLSFVVHFPPTACTRLAQRLMDIARKQNIKTDLGTLLALSKKSQNDIRSCVSLLHFFKAKCNGVNAEVKMSDVVRSSVGQKDVQKGLFTVWQEIFQIQRLTMKRMQKENLEPMPDLSAPVVAFGDTSLTGRMHSVLRTVQSCGDYEKLTTGVFENYLHMNIKDTNMKSVVNGLEWFCNTDVMHRTIYGEQNYVLMPYLPLSFVVWHFNFASHAWPKISYPNAGFENSQKEFHNKQHLRDLLRGMVPHVRVYTSALQLILDTIPLLLDILVPNLRPVSTQLYSTREKAELHQVISIMIDYNLTYIQERTQDGSYVFNLDPNIEALSLYPGMKPTRTLSYAGKQMLAREIELEKMRLAESRIIRDQTTEDSEKRKKSANNTKESKPVVTVPSHLQTLKPKPVVKVTNDPGMTKDFFGRLVPCLDIGERQARTDEIVKSDIWFHFKEGFSNAVRRAVRIQDLL